MKQIVRFYYNKNIELSIEPPANIKFAEDHCPGDDNLLIGYAEHSASTENWLNVCPAILRWEEMSIWDSYQVWSVVFEDETENDFLETHQSFFKKDLINTGGASNDEADKILDIMFDNATYYSSAKEAIDDYREYHRWHSGKLNQKRLNQIFNSPDYYDDDIELSTAAIKTLEAWKFDPSDHKGEIPDDAIGLLDEYFENGWWRHK